MEKYTNVHCKYVSAKTNENIEELFNNIVEKVYHDKKYLLLTVNYNYSK